MIRTQIQLTEQQAEALRSLAKRDHVSLAEVIRRGLDDVLARAAVAPQAELERRAIEIAGRFASGGSDVAIEHDKYLDEAFGAARR